MSDDFVELSEAIGIIRDQLRMAREAGEGQEPRFVVGRVEVELAVEARREGGLKFGVSFLGANAGVSSASTHRVTLELHPAGVDGGDFDVKSTTPELPAR